MVGNVQIHTNKQMTNSHTQTQNMAFVLTIKCAVLLADACYLEYIKQKLKPLKAY